MDSTSFDKNADLKEVSELDEEAIFDKLQEWYEADDEHSVEWRKDAYEAYDFYAGRQWSDTDKDKLTDEKRPVITFNRTLTIVKAVAGIEISGRHDTVFLPREPDTEEARANEVLTAGSNWMADECDAEDEQSEAFQDTLITGMGWTEATVNFDEEADGKYVEAKIDPLEMRWDRSARAKNLADAKRMFRAREMPLKDAQDMFPDCDPDDLNAGWATKNEAGTKAKTREQKRKREESAKYYDPNSRVTIVHAQWIEHEPYHKVAHPKVAVDLMGRPTISGFEELEMSSAEFAEYKAAAEAQGLPFESAKLKRKVYKQAFLGAKVLSGIQDGPVGNIGFSWTCITGERDSNKGTWFGMVALMKDPQMWANKWMSQTLHILNTTAKGGIIAEKGAFSDIREAQRTYAKADTITEVADGSIQKGRIMQKPGGAIGTPYLGMMEFAISSIRDSVGVNLELLGMRDANQAGILEHQRKQAGLTILATLFDSLRRFRKRIGRVRLYYLQEYFADGRMVRVAGPDGMKFVRLSKERMMGKYDVEIDDAPTSPNQREQNWLIIQQVLPAIRDILDPELVALMLDFSPVPAQFVEALKKKLAEPKPAQQAREQLEMRGLQAEVGAVEAKAAQDKAAAMKSRAGAILDLANAYAKGSEMRLNDAKANQVSREINVDEILAQVRALASEIVQEPESSLPQLPTLPTGPARPNPALMALEDLPMNAGQPPASPMNGTGF